jgi:hypothetical protein
MDSELLRSLQITDQATMTMIEHVQGCIVVYEQTLKAMGIYPPDTVSQAVDNSQLSYARHREVEEAYADVSNGY